MVKTEIKVAYMDSRVIVCIVGGMYNCYVGWCKSIAKVSQPKNIPKIRTNEFH